MFDLAKIFQQFVDEFSIKQFFRLVIIVGGYIFFRQRALDFIKTRQVKNQIDEDNKRKAEGLIDRPEDFVEVTPLEKSEQAWGWGKSTRKRVKAQEKLFEEKIEELAVKAQKKIKSGYDSDDELNDLLQD
ncbi:hypothetical protein CANARDRAFT_201854 [[Candida] arabinofermentans NRRL YB-2248]|uniref:Processing of GAS1 and ALP protein 2 n=1 Tax=[Candida] arabinofermentans NRRL YB-2248 TaxID=983967 RepID=A0A1E4SWW4_9ASCO|nr:hypothetical protein CANARDRAFT_201854 [[Candida] arabinofermentans NRRL YB-2248]